MGKGDIKTKKGKVFAGSYGKSRMRKRISYKKLDASKVVQTSIIENEKIEVSIPQKQVLKSKEIQEKHQPKVKKEEQKYEKPKQSKKQVQPSSNEKKESEEDFKIEQENDFRGEIKYEVTSNYVQTSLVKDFPLIEMPKNKSLVRKCHQLTSFPKGVTEDDFYAKLKSYFSDIRQGQYVNTENKTHNYKPDIVLAVEEQNLFIDIEIDEPYDGISRKPQHFHQSSDSDRNLYFNENGWVVIRFTEEQVFKYSESCCKLVAKVVDVLVSTDYSKSFTEVEDLTDIQQWTEAEARELAENRFRESYLEIEFQKGERGSGDDVIESYGNTSATQQVIPKEAKIEIIEFELPKETVEKKERLEKLIGKYAQFLYADQDVKDIVKIEKVEQDRRSVFAYGHSLIKNEA